MICFPAVFEIKNRVPNAPQFRMSLLSEVLTCVTDEERLRQICFSVGMGSQGELIRNIDHLLAYLQNVRDGFHTCGDLSLVLTDVDCLPIYDLLSNIQAHGLHSGGSLDDLRSRLVHHFITSECEIVSSGADIPSCRSGPRDNANLQSFLSRALESKLR